LISFLGFTLELSTTTELKIYIAPQRCEKLSPSIIFATLSCSPSTPHALQPSAMSETQHAWSHAAADGEERQFDLAVATTTWFDAGSKMEACPSDEGVRFSLVRIVTL
jgi:hypothetical protein